MKHRVAIFTALFLTIAGATQAQKEEKTTPPSLAQDVQRAPACPQDMIEVQGNYCPSVLQNCLNLDRSIHNANGYVRCLKFAPTQCLSKERVPMHFCIDKYEFPNREGVKPTVMVSWNEMKVSCEAVGRRLCSDHEWTLSCEGPEMLPYPYGYDRNDAACNIDNPQRQGFDASKFRGTPAEVAYLDQRVPSGSMPACVSPYGVYDMTGNVDESVVNSEHGQPMDPAHPTGKKQFYSAEMGGHWVIGARNRCRPKTTVHDETTVFYEIGGRCCRDAQ